MPETGPCGDPHYEKFRNSVLVFPLKVTGKIGEWQKLTYELGETVNPLMSRNFLAHHDSPRKKGNL
jgi:hypothetical protein